MKVLTNFLLKNWSAILLFALLTGAWAWVSVKNKKIEQQEVALAAALEDNKKLVQDVKRVEAVLDSARTDIRRLSELNDSDSIFYAQQIDGLQSVVAQVRAKAKREKEADAELIVELRKGLPPKECYNCFGRRVDCKD